ncbi:DUF465 domain-containing protein [Dethiosulfatarculus sandiegensis]|nr:DUF465 domain-containing protein [Dethiosulfatarculus sandiegensis]
MEEKDLNLLEQLRQENTELNALWVEHIELEKKVSELSERLTLSPPEQVELKRIKKLKLKGRDRIDEILSEHRQEQGLE